MKFVFKLPDLGEGTTKAEIVQWHVAVGDLVREDQPLVDMMTDKATMEIPSPVAGEVTELHGAPGDTRAVGSALIVFDVAGDGAQAKAAEARAAPVEARPAPAHSLEAPPTPSPAPPRVASGDKATASPAVRRKAAELGVSLADVPASGPGGRVLREDLEAYAAGGRSVAKPVDPPSSDGFEAIRIIGLRRMIAERMQEASRRIPHITYVEEIDVSKLESLREHLNAEYAGKREKLTVLPFLMRAIVKAIERYPQCNALFDDEAGVVKRSRAAHIGVATQTDAGLMVPVVRHAERLDLWRSAGEVARLAARAREGKASREELTGSTITISSLGPLGGLVSTPIINAPEVAIVGVNRIVERPIVQRGQIAVAKMMNLSSSFDHRIIDGWDAASFVQAIKTSLEEPATLFIEGVD
jgi:2-oxoisovalerate dehydrogenase E2 component (dihydrolipoyl transacylase)